MKRPPDTEKLMRSAFLKSNIISNLLGGPVTGLYGAFMMDFSNLSAGRFVAIVAIVMFFNLVLLSIPLNIFLLRKLTQENENIEKNGIHGSVESSFHFIHNLPFLQSALVFFRMFICASAVVLALGPVFLSTAHTLAVLIFGIYASYVTATICYYYLKGPVSAHCEKIVAGLPEDDPLFTNRDTLLKNRILSILMLLFPTILTSLGIYLLVSGITHAGEGASFLTRRVAASLILNLGTIIPLNFIVGRYNSRRLGKIREVLEGMLEDGKAQNDIPTDLGDDYAYTAHLINRSFRLFRFMLSGIRRASEKIAGSINIFSGQINETVSAATQQATAVKEIVSTMENSSSINRQIETGLDELVGQAQNSMNLVGEGFGKIQDSIKKMDEIKDANILTRNEIDELGEDMSSIGEIIEIISGIAYQTRIIAFNAELEAGAAGSAGSSFRIVAEEIRRLANNTVDSLAGIKNRIARIQESSIRLQHVAEEGTDKIEDGMLLSGDLNNIFINIQESIDNTNRSSGNIRDVLFEQTEAFDQIFLTIRQISEGADQMLSGTRTSGVDIETLHSLADELNRLLVRFRYEESNNSRGQS